MRVVVGDAGPVQWAAGAVGGGLADAALQGLGILSGAQSGFDWRRLAGAVAGGAAGGAGGYLAARGMFAACFVAGTPIE